MRAVLYAQDMEPITIIDLSCIAEKYLLERGIVTLAVPEPTLRWVSDPDEVMRSGCRTVTIIAERFMRNGRWALMLFTHDEENALLLDADFLPGQQRTLSEGRRKAFAEGVLWALERVCR